MTYGEYIGWLAYSMGFDSHGMAQLECAWPGMSHTPRDGWEDAADSIYKLPEFLIPTERHHPEWRLMAETFIFATLEV